MLRVVHAAGAAMTAALERGVGIADITAASVLAELGRMRGWPSDQVDESAARLTQRLTEEMSSL
jgi:V/A-type H+-transporting ATPase subunit A